MRILIVDDHPMMLEYLSGAAGCAVEGAEVVTVADLDEAFESAGRAAPSLVLLDLGLPGCEGIEALLRFREQFPKPRVIVVSAVADARTIRGAFAAGAAGYIPKTAKPNVVVDAIRLVVDGGSYVPPEALDAAPAPGAETELTGRQAEVLRHLLRGRTIAQIARELGIAEATAKHHAHAVYAAFGVSSRADLLVAAQRKGRHTG